MTGMGATVEDGGHCTVFVCQKCLHRQWISNNKLEWFRDNYPASAIDSTMLDAPCVRCHCVVTLVADPVAKQLLGRSVSRTTESAGRSVANEMWERRLRSSSICGCIRGRQ